jgi:MoxR-like ATPase
MTTQISVRIIRRGDSWRLTTRAGRDAAGKWRETSETVRGSRAEAEKRKAEIRLGRAPQVDEEQPERGARLVDYALASAKRALVEGRLAPSVDDVAALAAPVLKHRIALTFAARADGVTLPSVIDALRKVVG